MSWADFVRVALLVKIGFYTIEQVSKFVPPGSIRIGSTEVDPELANVAWRRPDGAHVLLGANTGSSQRSFTMDVGTQQFSATLDGGSVGTFVW